MEHIQNKKHIFIIIAVMFAVVGSTYIWNKQIATDTIVNTADTQIAAVEYTPLQSLPGTGIQKGVAFKTLSADLFNNAVFFVIGIAIVLAVLMIVIGGIQYMGSDAFTSKEDAKSKITMALFGLLIAFGAWLLLNTINPDLVTFKILEPIKDSETATRNEGKESEPGVGGNVIAEPRTEPGYYSGNERFDNEGDCKRAHMKKGLTFTMNTCREINPISQKETREYLDSLSRGHYYEKNGKRFGPFASQKACFSAVAEDYKSFHQDLQKAYESCSKPQ